MIRGLLERLWALLPDRCGMRGAGCRRRGVRGNENRYGKFLLCDDCHARLIRRKRP